MKIFITSAFSFKEEHLIDVKEDPTVLAGTDELDIEKVKVGTVYSMEIYHNCIVNYCNGVSDTERNDIDKLLGSLLTF